MPHMIPSPLAHLAFTIFDGMAFMARTDEAARREERMPVAA